MSTKSYQETIKIPEKVTAELDGIMLKIKGEKGVVERSFLSPVIKIKKEGKDIVLSTEKFSRKAKTMFNTFRAHIRNMIKGVSEVYVYKLKVCASHFPIAVEVAGSEVLVKNFFGEQIPRKAAIFPDTAVVIKGDVITVTSPSKENAGQTAANIENATRITNRDKRVFQDGCYIFEKAGKPLI